MRVGGWRGVTLLALFASCLAAGETDATPHEPEEGSAFVIGLYESLMEEWAAWRETATYDEKTAAEYVDLAGVCVDEDNHEDARAYLKQALDAAGDAPLIQYWCASFYRLLGDHEESARLAKRVAETEAISSTLAYVARLLETASRARIHGRAGEEEEGEYGEEEWARDKALADDPFSMEMMQASMELGETGFAAEALRKEAQYLAEAGDYAAARRKLDEAFATGSEASLFLMAASGLCLLLDDTERVEALSAQFLGQEKVSTVLAILVHRIRGTMFHEYLDRPEDARQEYEAALTLRRKIPDDAPSAEVAAEKRKILISLFRLSLEYEALCDADTLAVYAAEGLTDPEYRHAPLYRALLAAERGDMEAARAADGEWHPIRLEDMDGDGNWVDGYTDPDFLAAAYLFSWMGNAEAMKGYLDRGVETKQRHLRPEAFFRFLDWLYQRYPLERYRDETWFADLFETYEKKARTAYQEKEMRRLGQDARQGE